MGENRTPTSVRHVYDDSGEPSGLLLLCHCRHCFHPRWALAVAFRRPLACCPRCAIGGLRPSPHRTTAHAMPTQRSRSSTPHAHRCPTPGIRAEFSSPPFRIAPNPQDRLPSPTRSTAARNPNHIVLVKRVQCHWIRRHRVFRTTSGEPKNRWKETAKPSPHFVLVKRGCAPWPPFTAVGPSVICRLSFQERSRDHR